jgi:uncharacterized cupin superfamily protein
VIVKATGEQTGAAFGLIDNLMPAGFASPYHMHRNEDESFYVVEGEMTFYVGDERVKGGLERSSSERAGSPTASR